jgi:hypothetical protein
MCQQPHFWRDGGGAAAWTDRVRDDGLQLLVSVAREGYKLKHPSMGQQIGSAKGRHPSPGGHGLLHATVAGD